MAGEHLLIVDDEDNLRSMLSAALSHNGFEITTASNGAEALHMIAESAPDLIVLDVMMPELDGFEVCRRLRADNNHTPVLFLTARDGTEDKVRGLTLGGDDYLQKPFSLEELVARATAILRRTGAINDQSTVLQLEDLSLDDDAPYRAQSGSQRAPVTDRVQVAALSVDQPGPGAFQVANPGSRLGIRLRRRRWDRRNLYRLPPPQARYHRTETDPHHPRRRLLRPRSAVNRQEDCP